MPLRSSEAFAPGSAKAFAIRFVESCVVALFLSAVACGTRSETPDDRPPAASPEAPLPAVAGATVVLAGMEAPPNYGFEYSMAFHKVYPAIAKKYRVALVPFLLEGVAGISDLNQADGIHPTAQGAQLVADNVWTVLKKVVEDD